MLLRNKNTDKYLITFSKISLEMANFVKIFSFAQEIRVITSCELNFIFELVLRLLYKKLLW